MREPLSAFIITLNEEERIADCISSVSFCDEVLVVDSFSSDRTVEIAESLGARVIQNPWKGYKEQKAFALSQCRHDWVLNVDADEYVNSELKGSIIAVLEQIHATKQAGRDLPYAGYYVNRVTYHLGRFWRRSGWYPEYRLRLMNRRKTTWGGRNPHEKPLVDGKCLELRGELEHYSYRDLKDQIDRLNSFSSISAQYGSKDGDKFSLIKLMTRPVLRFFKFYFVKRGFKEGTAGFVVAVSEAFYTFMKYAKLWELEQASKWKQAKPDKG